MRLYDIVRLLIFCIGKKNVARLQMWLKYQISFKRHYKRNDFIPKTVVFMVDGKTHHGGLSDRLRGLFSIYYYCKQRGYNFKIAWNYPFELQEYLMPANKNWIAVDWEVLANSKTASFRFFNSYIPMTNQESDYFQLLDFKKPIAHVYSNVTIREDLFCDFFQELFIPAPNIQNAVKYHLSILGKHFYSMAFRFVSLLGDFRDTDNSFQELDKSEKEEYIAHSLDAIKKVHNEMFAGRIFVTSDSASFLSEAAKIPYVYIISGEIEHIDGSISVNNEAYKKMFVDFLIISKAEKIYSYQYGKMYAATGFAKTAALIGGKKCEIIKEHIIR